MGTKKLMRYTIITVLVLAFGAYIAGCAHFPGMQGPTIKAEPAAAVMAPPALAAVKITGSGFKAGDRVEIVLAKADKGQDVPIAFGEANAEGVFETKMDMLSILQGIFHFQFQGGKPVPNPNNPPLKPGAYVMQGSSWDSKLSATCNFEIQAPPPPKKP